jgi:glutaredoxin
MIRAAASALCVLACALVFDGAHAQQLYRWIDDQGNTHITDTPPPPSVKRFEKKRFTGSVVEGGADSFELKRAMQQAPVTLYTSPSCKEPCELARATLNKRGVPFKEVQVWDEETNAELERVVGARSVPSLRVGSYVQRGYSQENFDNALDIGGYPNAGVLPVRKQAAPKPPEGYTASGPQLSPAADKPEAPAPKPGPYTPRFSGNLPAGTPGSSGEGRNADQGETPRPLGPYTPRFSQ